MKRIFFLLIFILIKLSTKELCARENLRTGPIREFYKSTYGMGMGNAYLSSVRNCEALYYNGAALARLPKEHKVDVLNPQLEFNKKVFSILPKSSKMLKDNSQMVSYMKDNIGKPQYLNASLTPGYCYRGFGFGLFYIREYDFFLYNRANPTIDVYARNDYGFSMGYTYKIFSGRIKLGYVIKYINRSEIDKKVMADEVVNSEFDLQTSRDGTGLGMDGSAQLTMLMPMLPRLNFVVENIGGTSFKKKESSTLGSSVEGAPSPMRQRLHVGLGLTPKVAKKTKMSINLEMRDVLRPTHDYYRLAHIGVDIDPPIFFKFRFGFNQGYLTYGLSFDFGSNRLDLASYAIERGAYAGQLEDRRYMLKYIFSFGTGKK